MVDMKIEIHDILDFLIGFLLALFLIFGFYLILTTIIYYKTHSSVFLTHTEFYNGMMRILCGVTLIFTTIYAKLKKGMGLGKEIEIREVSEKEAEKMIINYLKKHKGAWISEIVTKLKIEPEVVAKVLRKMKKEKKVK